jgi:hypothetical protein
MDSNWRSQPGAQWSTIVRSGRKGGSGVDGSVVAIAAASLLAARLGEGFAGEAGKSAWGAAKRLAELVRSKFAGDPDAMTALDGLQTGPPDPARIRAVAEALQNHAERDETFRAALRALVAEAEGHGSGPTALTEISGNARVGKVATIGDVQGDVSF